MKSLLTSRFRGRGPKLLLAALGAVILVLIATSALAAFDGSEHGVTGDLSSLSRCEVGGSPSLRVSHYLLGPGRGKPLIPAVVIGCGKSSGEPIELVATHTTTAFCFVIDRIRRMSSQGGECRPNRASWTDWCSELCVYSVLPTDLGRNKHLRRMIVSGQAPLATSRVKITFSEGEMESNITAVVAPVVTAAMLQELRQTEPFVVFGAVVPRCIPGRSIRVVAEDGTGKDIGRARGHNLLPCKAPPLPKPPS